MSNKTKNGSSSVDISINEDKQSEKEMPFRTIEVKNPGIKCNWKRRVLLLGITMAIWCATFTSTGLGVALGKIASDFNDFGNMSWYLTGFLLGSAVFQLLSIRISDCLGRKRTYLFASTFMVVSGVLCALSVNSFMFIVFRVFEGISAGLCVAVSTAVIV
ncbi:MFS general substrate transporter, partial [Backusella circina FSU 941]